jgi:hypothetical protein
MKSYILISIILYILGVVSVAYYPQFANKTYISENALLPGAGKLMYSVEDINLAIQFSKDFSDFVKTSSPNDKELRLYSILLNNFANIS